VKYAKKRGIPLDPRGVTSRRPTSSWVIEGEGELEQESLVRRRKRFFDWLESKAYKMHIRVLLSKYRAYTPCHGLRRSAARPKRSSGASVAGSLRCGVPRVRAALPAARRHWSEEILHSNCRPLRARSDAAPARTVARDFFRRLELPATARCRDGPAARGDPRPHRLPDADVGLGYLTLDRQSRTLSGGEVQRINLTTALGTSLVNTLFVLDEPSIGLHPRDMRRVIAVMQRLRDAGNSLRRGRA
jgi:excinuclease ABC subunit A